MRIKAKKKSVIYLSLCAVLLCGGCAGSGLVTQTGGHRIKVTSATKARHGLITNESLHEQDGAATYRYHGVLGTKTAERATEVTIKDEDLIVNGKSYGKLKPGDSITVDGGRVLINEQEVQEIASR